MYPILATWRRWLRSLLPYAILTAVFASGLIGLDRLHASATTSVSQQTTAASQRNPAARGVINPPVCGAQLGIAGYSITLGTASNEAQIAQTALGLGASDLAPEFLPLTAASSALQADAATQELALDRMSAVHVAALGAMSESAIVAKLQSTPGVSAAEPIFLQSSDKRYLACDYKLKDNAIDQAFAATARQALIAHGASSALLDDAGTMEFVSLRHFNGRQLLQVAFIRRLVGTPTVAYVAVMDPGTRAVLAVARANWYLWG